MFGKNDVRTRSNVVHITILRPNQQFAPALGTDKLYNYGHGKVRVNIEQIFIVHVRSLLILRCLVRNVVYYSTIVIKPLI